MILAVFNNEIACCENSGFSFTFNATFLANALVIATVIGFLVMAGINMHSLITGLTSSDKMTLKHKADMCKHVDMSASFVHWSAIIAFGITAISLGIMKTYTSGMQGYLEALLDTMQAAINLYLLVGLSHAKDMAYQNFNCPAIIEQHKKDVQARQTEDRQNT